MKKIFLVFGLFFIFANIASAKEEAIKPDTYEYDLAVTGITGVKEPYVTGNYVVFTYPTTVRAVGIAFDFENFRKIHSFQLRKNYDYEGELTSSYYFYILEKPVKLSDISYRLVIDGLWTTDPLNPNTIYNETEGISFSHLSFPVEESVLTEKKESGMTHFVCFAKSGERIRLAGTFTNWDSWIYEMTETKPGKYEIDIPLPSGTYFYAYYMGTTSFLDSTNQEKGYSKDGRVVSRIVVN